MKIKLFFSTLLLLLIAAITWTACEKSPLIENSKITDAKTLSRGDVLFDDATPPVTVSGHQLTSVTISGGQSGYDTAYVLSTGILDVVELVYKNGVYISADTLAALGFIRDSTFVCPTTAAFRAGYPTFGAANWDVEVHY